ncbi:MAG: MATE family efflux transporter [Pseudomonadota bacterium]
MSGAAEQSATSNRTNGSGAVRPFEVTHRGIVAIALPMTLAYLSTPILGIVDTTVIGRLGDAALLGGIAIGAIIFNIIFTTFNFLRSGTTGLAAQALGAADDVEMRGSLYRAILVGLVSGIAVIILQWPILEAGLWLMAAEDEVVAAVRDYFTIRVLGTPMALINYAILGWFIGLGRSGSGLFLQTLLNGLNALLNIWFVLGLGWGVAGVAWGTVISETVTAIAGLLWAAILLRGRWGLPEGVLLARHQLARMFAMNGDIMIRSFLLLLAFTLFTAGGARQGTVVLAANAVLLNFLMLGAHFLDGLATAAEQFAGRAVGARYKPAFVQSVRLTLIWSFVLAAVLSLLMLAAGNAIIDLMTTSEDVRMTARTYLVWAALTPLAGVLAFQQDGVFIGATWSADMRNMMLLSFVLFLGTIWLAEPRLGNHGIWLALHVLLITRGLLLLWRYPIRLRRTFVD